MAVDNLSCCQGPVKFKNMEIISVKTLYLFIKIKNVRQYILKKILNIDPMYNFTLFEVPDPSIFISDWLIGIRPVSGSGSSKTEGNFIFDSYTEWWSSIVELPRILRSSAKLVLLFRYGSVSFKIDKGGWFFINRDDIEGWDVVDSVEISLLWLSMFVNSCWLEGTPMAERERKFKQR